MMITKEHNSSIQEIFVCPNCHSRLSFTQELITCTPCQKDFPVYFGIPDFRSANDNFHTPKNDATLLDALLSAYDRSSFHDLIDIRYSHSKQCPKELVQAQKDFELSYEEKGTARTLQIQELLDGSRKALSKRDVFLDVGCGSGTALPWMMHGFQRGLGVDYSLVDLILGSKFIQELGFKNVQLICADARYLPLAEGAIDFANATDVIEHILPGQYEFLAEVGRVLKKEGFFYFNSPNRYNLFTPEPHVKVRFVGFLPRKWMDGYVRAKRGVNYRNYRLLSLVELRNIIRKNFGEDYCLRGPFFEFHRKQFWLFKMFGKSSNMLIKILNTVLLPILTNYHVLVYKN